MRELILLAGLVACEPSDADYIAAARAELAANSCCGFDVDGRCWDKCTLVDGATITATHVEPCCAGSGKHVVFMTDGPSGKAECTFQLLHRRDKVLPGEGGCHKVK